MQKITPNLWFDTEAEEAAKFYTSIFERSRITNVSHYGEGAHLPAGTVLTVSWEIEGQQFTGINGGPADWKPNESVSFSVECEDQAEVDRLWEALTDGGEESQCGWLKDRYGFSWQIIPKALPELLQHEDSAAAQRAMQAMFQMKKIDVAALQRAFDGEEVPA